MNDLNTNTTSYDQIPYTSNPFAQSHPDRLATIATILGLDPSPISNARVLELGCAAGGNLIPMAEQFPESSFLGIDASHVQVADGQRLIEQLELKNVQLACRDILEFDLNQQPFDYIICHGVYSWVPNAVQDRVLEICGKCLVNRGVAYISYNTYPGWHMRYMIRDIMRYRARLFDLPEQKLTQARGLISFLTAAVQNEETPHSIMLRRELENINRADDSYLHHEHLEDINAPIYFFEFAERASRFGLQYLGEADFGNMSLGNLSDNTRAMFQGVSRDVVELEQYMDFLRNRAFRQTLLCKDGISLDRIKQVQRMVKLCVASPAQPTSPIADLHAKEKTEFTRNQSTLQTNDPTVRAAFVELQKAWPKSIPFPVLASMSRSIATGKPCAADSDVLSQGNQRLAETLLRCYETSMLDLYTAQPTFLLATSERPLGSPLARAQAQASGKVTNRMHCSVFLDDLQRQVLIALDGSRDFNELVQFLASRIMDGDVVVFQGQQRIVDRDEARLFAEKNIPNILVHLRQSCLVLS